MVPKIVSAAVVAVALLIAGCGGSHKSADTATQLRRPTGATTPTATAETRPEVPADHAIASGALLTLPDFPTGWEQQGQSRGQELADLSGDRDRPGVAVRPRHQPPVRQGLRRLRGRCRLRVSEPSEAPDVVRRAERLPPTDSASARRWATSSPRRRQSSSATKVTFGQPSAGSLSISTVGDQSAAGRITIPYTVQGLNPNAVVDLVFVRVDRGIQILVVHRLRRCLRSRGRGRSDTDRGRPAGRGSCTWRRRGRRPTTTTTPTTIHVYDAQDDADVDGPGPHHHDAVHPDAADDHAGADDDHHDADHELRRPLRAGPSRRPAPWPRPSSCCRYAGASSPTSRCRSSSARPRARSGSSASVASRKFGATKSGHRGMRREDAGPDA